MLKSIARVFAVREQGTHVISYGHDKAFYRENF